MKKILVKTGIYSFIVSFLLLFVLMDRGYNSTDVSGLTSSVVISYPDFLFMITRNSIIISIFVVILVYAIQRFKKNKA